MEVGVGERGCVIGGQVDGWGDGLVILAKGEIVVSVRDIRMSGSIDGGSNWICRLMEDIVDAWMG